MSELRLASLTSNLAPDPSPLLAPVASSEFALPTVWLSAGSLRSIDLPWITERNKMHKS
jgi:hypothetical protein